MPILVFHSPLPIERPLDSGSAVRPKRMLEAFRALGHEVLVVDGDSAQRRTRWREVAALPPERLIGIYAELSTSPIALTDPDHLPRAPWMDARHFASARAAGVPTAAFYRDAYWRFLDRLGSVSRWKAAILRSFHHLEWRQLRRSFDHCFVPSLRMLQHLPPLGDVSASELPPGGTVREREIAEPTAGSSLRLLYVGGVSPPDYDLGPMFAAVEGLAGVALAVSCRAGEWQRTAPAYRVPANVTIVHRSGEDLDQLYLASDAFLDWRPANEYLAFAVPVKTFEAVGWALPIVANGRLPTGRLAVEEGFGWGPETPEALRALLANLAADAGRVSEVARRVATERQRHTWEARATTVVETLRLVRERRA